MGTGRDSNEHTTQRGGDNKSLEEWNAEKWACLGLLGVGRGTERGGELEVGREQGRRGGWIPVRVPGTWRCTYQDRDDQEGIVAWYLQNVILLFQHLLKEN